MKHIAMFLFLLILVSCTVTEPKHFPRQVTFLSFDFTPFTEKGFFFTPEKYTSNYESIGLITCIISPDEKQVEISRSDQNQKSEIDDVYYSTALKDYIWAQEIIKPYEILQIIYDECIKMGADAFVNFKYDTVQMPSKSSIFRETKYYVITGFAIKR